MGRLKDRLDDKVFDILMEEAFRHEQEAPEPEELPPELAHRLERVKGQIQKNACREIEIERSQKLSPKGLKTILITTAVTIGILASLLNVSAFRVFLF